MPLDASDVNRIATLARLAIEPDETGDYVRHLSGIVDFVKALDAADTTGVAPMAHPLETAQRLRPDDVTETDHREHYQSAAPAVENGLYLVPKVIE